MGHEASSNVHHQQKQKPIPHLPVTVISTKPSTDGIKHMDIRSPDQYTPTTPTKSTAIYNNSYSSLILGSNKSVNGRKNSLLQVNNGITGTLISSKICRIAATFWSTHIETLSIIDQLEIGMSIYFGMLSASGEMKNIMKNIGNFSPTNQIDDITLKIESTSLRYLDMMGWLIRHLASDADLTAQLLQLGNLHEKMGIRTEHYEPMLQSLHETFAYYFGSDYNVEVKYAIIETFSFAAGVMTGKSLKCNAHLNDINISFLKNLDVCLNSSIGKDYLYKFLSQTFCDEIVIFHQSLSRFKHLTCDKERYIVAKNITQRSIHQEATFCLNLSYETRHAALSRMAEKEQLFMDKNPLEISTEFFSEVEHEVNNLIMNNQWHKFVQQIKSLQAQTYID